MKLLLLSAADLREALPMPAAIDAAEEAFVAHAEGQGTWPQRAQLPVPEAEGTALVMPGHLPGVALATKLVSVFPGNQARGLGTVSGLVVVMDEETGIPRALVDGAFLTSWRTGAAGGAAARWLARPDARVGALLGAGAQAETQLLGMDAARELEVVRLWSRDVERARALQERLAPQVQASLEVVARPEEALEGADLVACATSSSSPLFEAEALEPGAHLTSVGSFRPDMVEVDPALAARARVVVDDREAALEEAGELIRARDQGRTDPSRWVLLGDVIRGRSAGRAGAAQCTWFKSVGLAAQDLTAVGAALRSAEARGLGREVDL